MPLVIDPTVEPAVEPPPWATVNDPSIAIGDGCNRYAVDRHPADPDGTRRDDPPMIEQADLLSGLGRVALLVGGLLLSFAAFQLWGTGVLEWHAQGNLDAQFADTLAERRARSVAIGTGGVTEPTRLATTAALTVAAASGTSVDLTSLLAAEALIDRPTTLLVAGAGPQPAEGEALGRLEIPAIGVTKTFAHGVERATLRHGPGRYPSTVLPGRRGNAAIAGHRTTHGAPFFDLDRLVPGDEIVVETVEGRFTYLVEGHVDADGAVQGHHLVDPSAVEVLADHGDNRLTLTACHPKYTAQLRIIVTATLVGEPMDLAGEPIDAVSAAAVPPQALPRPAPPPPALPRPADVAAPVAPLVADEATAQLVVESSTVGQASAAGRAPADADDALDASLGWQRGELEPTVLWGTSCSLAMFAAWALGRMWRRLPVYVAAAPLVAVTLVACFIHLDRLLPAV